MTDNTRRVVVGPVAEIPPGGRKLVVPFRGRAGIGVFNINGEFHALRNLCPHKSGPLCTGRIGALTVSTAPPTVEGAQLDLIRDGEMIRCPWHFWEFDLITGQCLVDPKARVKKYPVSIEDGQIVVYANEADLPVVDQSRPVPA